MVDTTTYGLDSLQYTAANIWHDILDSIKMIDNLAELKNILWETYDKCIISE